LPKRPQALLELLSDLQEPPILREPRRRKSEPLQKGKRKASEWSKCVGKAVKQGYSIRGGEAHAVAREHYDKLTKKCERF